MEQEPELSIRECAQILLTSMVQEEKQYLHLAELRRGINDIPWEFLSSSNIVSFSPAEKAHLNNYRAVWKEILTIAGITEFAISISLTEHMALSQDEYVALLGRSGAHLYCATLGVTIAGSV